MTDECIHGLERDRCDICSPAAPVIRSPAKRATTPTPRRTPSRPAPASKRAAGAPERVADVSRQRLHHVTPMGNLAAILAAGGLYADSTPPVDISSPGNREVRRTTDAAGSTVAEHVPFFLSPDAYIWQAVRTGADDPRLAPTVPAAADFVVLVTTVEAVGGATSVVVADGDAAAAVTRFAAGDAVAARMTRVLADADAALRAEVLVRELVPFEAVSLVGVAHDRARDAVRDLLAGSGFTPRVAVHPPWFAAPEA